MAAPKRTERTLFYTQLILLAHVISVVLNEQSTNIPRKERLAAKKASQRTQIYA